MLAANPARMKTIRFSVFSILLSLAFTCALLATEKEEEDDSSSDDQVTVEKLILVRDAGDKFVPVDAFKPSDTFGVLVKLSGSKTGTKVKGVWTIVDAGGRQDAKIFEKTVTLTAEALKEAKEKDRIDFTLSHDNPYPTGDYKFEAYVNGQPADSIDFKIE